MFCCKAQSLSKRSYTPKSCPFDTKYILSQPHKSAVFDTVFWLFVTNCENKSYCRLLIDTAGGLFLVFFGGISGDFFCSSCNLKFWIWYWLCLSYFPMKATIAKA